MEIVCVDPLGALGEVELHEVLRGRVIPVAVDCVNWPEYSYMPRVIVRVAYTVNSLVLLFDVEEEHVRGVVMEEQGAVWEDSCVEFFVADPVGMGYYNFEVNCVRTGLAAHRLSRDVAEYFTDHQMRQWRRSSALKRELIDRHGDGLHWWMLEMIPFSLLGLEKVPERLQVNFYKCGDKCERPHFLSWSPIDLEKPDFHCPEFFGAIVFK